MQQKKAVESMAITLKDIIGLTKEIPEEYFKETFEKLKEIKEKVSKATITNLKS